MSPTDNCCSKPEPDAPMVKEIGSKKNLSLWTSSGALFSAMLSSACCWLPLGLVAFGASAGSVSGFFEEYRLYLLGATSLMLAASFYLVYFRKEDCSTEGSCPAPNPRLQRFNKAILWVAIVMVVGLGLFPNYIGYVIGGESNQSIPSAAKFSQTYKIEGMTCEACTLKVHNEIQKIEGVSSIKVSYKDKSVKIFFTEQATPDQNSVLKAISSLGYKGRLETTKGTNTPAKKQQVSECCQATNE